MTRAERITTEFVRCVIDYRRVAIFLGVLLLIPCAVACTGLRVNNTITTWFLESDPYLQSYYAYQKVFGNDEVAVIAFREPTGLFTPATLELLRTVSRRIGAQRHVQRVLSIATATAIEGKDGTLSVRPVLAETGPIDAAQAARVRQVLLDDPIYRGNILSDDQKTT
ncbi:MAG: hypothetical protein HY303_21690, partial [Candidatus Wallbacteria bacterium]|nr:hypothetical protein [Candidatus Wallbacteria bacterium]